MNWLLLLLLLWMLKWPVVVVVDVESAGCKVKCRIYFDLFML